MDSRSKCLVLIIFSRKHTEKYTDDLRSPEWTPGDKTLIMETPKKIIKILSFLGKNPKSIACSPELNIGRSETNEDSTSM